MNKFGIFAGIIVAVSLAAACGETVVDMDGGAGGGPMCASNADCPGQTLENQQCGYHPCIDGVCVTQNVDAGTPCITGYADNDASAPVWGSCLDGVCLSN